MFHVWAKNAISCSLDSPFQHHSRMLTWWDWLFTTDRYRIARGNLTKLTNYKIQPGDLTLPNGSEWFIQYLNLDQLFKEQLVNWSQGNVTPGDNIAEYIYTTTVTTPSDYATGGFNSFSFKVPFYNTLTPTCVLIGSVANNKSNAIGTTHVSIPINGWSRNGNTLSVTINYIAGLAANSSYTATFLVK